MKTRKTVSLDRGRTEWENEKRRRKVRCTETGVVYESIKDAAERTKISPNDIGSAASGMAGGYHWEYADD